MATEVFEFGRARLRTGRDLLTVAGRYTPELDAAQDVNLGRSDGFRQQWLGLSEDTKRAVRVRSPARFNLDGFWFPRATSVSDVDAVTTRDGVFDYQGTFERVSPSYAQAGEGFVGTLANRDTTVHNVFAEGWVWWPSPVLWQEVFLYAATETISTPGGTLVGAEFANGDVGTGFLQRLGFAVEPVNVYIGSAQIQRQDDAGNWHTIVGKQIPDVDDPAKIRLRNGVVEGVWRQASDPNPGFDLDGFSQTTATWGNAGTFDIADFEPSATPAVVG